MHWITCLTCKLTNYVCRYQLEWEIKTAEWGNVIIHKFFVKMTNLWDQLAPMEPQFIYPVDSSTFDKYRQETILVQFFLFSFFFNGDWFVS